MRRWSRTRRDRGIKLQSFLKWTWTKRRRFLGGGVPWFGNSKREVALRPSKGTSPSTRSVFRIRGSPLTPDACSLKPRFASQTVLDPFGLDDVPDQPVGTWGPIVPVVFDARLQGDYLLASGRGHRHV